VPGIYLFVGLGETIGIRIANFRQSNYFHPVD
jgi:hypothetical protein